MDRAPIRQIALLLGLTLLLGLAVTPTSAQDLSRTVSVIVQGITGASDARTAVEDVGGTVTENLPIVEGVTADVPRASLSHLRNHPDVLQVTTNGKVGFQGDADFTATPARIGTITRSAELWDEGITGRGVTVALLDTGVYADHPDLAGRVVHCEDFSGEANTEAHCADTFGHGTFMAGLIAGNGSASNGVYKGSAPETNIVSLKMAGFDGATDVSNILAGIQWVVAHKNDYNIRALNLSLGSDSSQSHLLSPLNYAVQKAWKSGIAVVVSAGNSGPNSKTILKPADDPYVITVGSSNDEGTLAVNDDRVPVFSSRGPTRSGIAKPDVVAPGVHTVSLRSPGSAIDQQFGATAVVDDGYFRGTGTSMSTAVVTGVVAQMLQAKPSLSPDQVKYRLMTTARRIADTSSHAAGKGLVDAYAATTSTTSGKANTGLLFDLKSSSTGLGSIQQARGSLDLVVYTADGAGDLVGEVTAQYGGGLLNTLLGLVPYEPLLYTTTGWDATTWRATTWRNNAWAATTWRATTWRATTWRATTWRGSDWVNSDWEATTWRNVDWDATTWRATTWRSAWYAAAWE
ncbi:MAG TPA: S8 family peptidase [Actinomycetota bacterium]|nr:S8 family peptidase [Actinomycetota bacterium]